MTRPYSEDLDARALARFEAGETIRSGGLALKISPSCISDLNPSNWTSFG